MVISGISSMNFVLLTAFTDGSLFLLLFSSPKFVVNDVATPPFAYLTPVGVLLVRWWFIASLLLLLLLLLVVLLLGVVRVKFTFDGLRSNEWVVSDEEMEGDDICWEDSSWGEEKNNKNLFFFFKKLFRIWWFFEIM